MKNKDLTTDYLSYLLLEKKLSKNTIINYEFDLNNFLDYLE